MSKYSSIFFDSMGGVNAEGIRLALELEEVEDKPLIAQKLIVYLSQILSTQREDDKKTMKSSSKPKETFNG